MEAVVEELHKPIRRRYPRRKFEMRGISDTFQADLIDMQSYADENDGFKYLLTIIDVFSKYAYAVPTKSKNAHDITMAMKSVLSQGSIPKNLQVDQGSEFYNAQFKRLMKEHKINMYSSHSNLHASIIERWNRTIKNWMWKKFSLRGSYKYIDILPDLVKKYNAKVHRTIGMAPRDVSKKHEAALLKKFMIKKRRKKPKFKKNDKVRISILKHIFEKSYIPNWTTEIFTITRVAPTNPVTYHLEDYKGEPIAGGFYEQEIAKVKYPDLYLVEKVLRQRNVRGKKQIYVKWLGFDDSHNSWIDK